MQFYTLLLALLTVHCPKNGYHLIRDGYKFSDSLEVTFTKSGLITPSLLIAGGYIGSNVKYLKNVDRDFQDIAANFGPTQLDSYLVLAPIASVYFLNILGYEGENSLKIKSIALIGSIAIQTALVQSLKYSTQVMRPDSSARNSFPSMHAAVAFGGAEFLRQEYWYRMPWVVIGGYLAAGLVGMARVSNNKHWLTDVIVGAGVGILSTRISYCLVTHFRQKKPKKLKAFSVVSPYGDAEFQGLSIVIHF